MATKDGVNATLGLDHVVLEKDGVTIAVDPATLWNRCIDLTPQKPDIHDYVTALSILIEICYGEESMGFGWDKVMLPRLMRELINVESSANMPADEDEDDSLLMYNAMCDRDNDHFRILRNVVAYIVNIKKIEVDKYDIEGLCIDVWDHVAKALPKPGPPAATYESQE